MGAVLLFFFVYLLFVVVAVVVAVLTAGRDPSSPIFAVCLVTGTTAYFINWVRRLRANTFERHSGGHSEARTPVTPSTVIFADNNDNDNNNGNDNDNDNGNQGGSEGKNSVPIPYNATATTIASSTTTGASSFAIAVTLFTGRPSSERDYAALPTDNSVHDAHDMVTGVPISAQQKL